MLGPCPKVHRPLSSVTLWEDGSDRAKREIPDDKLCIAGTLAIFGQLHHWITFEKCWGGVIGWWLMLGQGWNSMKKLWSGWLVRLTVCWLGCMTSSSRGSGKSLEAGILFDKAAKIWLIFDGCVAKDKGTLQKSWQCSCEEALHGAEESDLQVILDTSTPRSLRCWWK